MMPPRISVGKVIAEDGKDSAGGTLDPAEESLQAAKEFTRRKRNEKTTKQTTENDWENEGGTVIDDETEEKLLTVEDVQKIANLSRISTTGAAPKPIPRHHLSQRFHDLLKEIGKLHDRKQKDYGTPEDPFANVRGATEFGLPAPMGAFLAMNDIMARIKSFIRNGKLENESLDNALRDMAVYSLIALVLWEEQQESNES